MSASASSAVTRGPVVRALVVVATIGACGTPLDPDAITEHGMTVRAQRYLDGALELVERNWMFRDQLDWDSVRAVAYRDAQGAESTIDTWEALKGMLRGLDDGHSRLQTPHGAVAVPPGGRPATAAPAGQTGARIIEDRIAFLPVAPSDLVGSLGDQWATVIAHQVATLEAQSPCGWIVDLRTNTGGNMWPTLAGLGSLTGEGRIGRFIDPVDGDQAVDWIYRSGSSWYGGQRIATAADPAVLNGVPRVAVLQGSNTASAGEAVAVAFRGKAGARSFGSPTAGASNAPRTHPLSDGALLILAELVFVDRTGRRYGRSLAPDEAVPSEITRLLESDAAMRRAAEWVLAAPECGQPLG